MKEKKKRRQNRINILPLVVLCMSALGLFSCGIFFWWMVASLDGTASCGSADIERLLYVLLPDDMENFESICGGFQGRRGEGRFDVSPEHFEEFISSESIDVHAISAVSSSNHFTRWKQDVESITQGLTGYSSTDVRYISILVDTTNDTRWIVYFIALAG